MTERLVALAAAAITGQAGRTSTDYAISYRGNPKGGALPWCGCFILPGDAEARIVVDASGEPVWRASTHEAEADAGHALVGALQAQKRAANP